MAVIDVPEPAHDREVAFWSGATGQVLTQIERHPDYHVGQLHSQEVWLLVQRKHRPFLLIPLNLKNLGRHVGLELYSAHRRRAKIWRAALPATLGEPAA